MQILIASPTPEDARRYREVLGSLGHDVTVVDGPADVARALASGPLPEVAILAETRPRWIAPLRGINGHIYVIASLEDIGERHVREAWDAGVDDVMSRRASAAEVAGRVDAVRRIRRWVAKMGDGWATPEGPSPGDLSAVRNLPELLATEFGQMTGSDLRAFRLDKAPHSEFAAEIPLTLSGDGTEMCLGIGVEAECVDAFSTLMFGERVGAELLCDAVREFANTAGGAVKRAALAEGCTFSLGLPEDAMLHEPPADVRSWRLEADGLFLVIWLGIRADAPRRVTASMLREGMVLAEPVRNGAGVMLVPQGSVLTERTVKRLLELLGPNTLVEVARSA